MRGRRERETSHRQPVEQEAWLAMARRQQAINGIGVPSWINTGNMGAARQFHKATLLQSGKVLGYRQHEHREADAHAEISAYTEASSDSGASPVGSIGVQRTARPIMARAFWLVGRVTACLDRSEWCASRGSSALGA